MKNEPRRLIDVCKPIFKIDQLVHDIQIERAKSFKKEIKQKDIEMYLDIPYKIDYGN